MNAAGATVAFDLPPDPIAQARAIVNAWRAAGLVAYDSDRALLTARDVPALRAIIDR